MLIGKILLTMLSFAGLCDGIRAFFHVDRYVAPPMAACSVIVLLNIGGMIGTLLPVWIVLYALGFLGAIYTWLIKRSKPEWLSLGLFAAFVLFLIFRFGRSYFNANDDISHWGLVARYLLRYDAFPTAAADFVRFQSYPLGAACFIYYLCRGTVNSEGAFLVAQYFLHGVLFMPVLQYIHPKKRRHMLPFSVTMFLLLLHFNDKMVTIQVDHLLGFFGLSIIALFYLYGKDLRKLTYALLPCLLAVVVIKNSGLVFAIAAAVGVWVVSRQGKDRDRRSPLAVVAVGGVPIVHYLLWIVRIRLVYTNALETKHAVSSSAYWAQIQEKGLSTIAKIAGIYMKALVTPSTLGLLAIGLLATISLFILWLAAVRGNIVPALRRMILNGLLYLAWALMLLIMYIISMPTSEALRLASFDRYNSTGLIVLIGAFLLHLEMEWNSAEATPKLPAVLMNCASFGSIACIVALYGMTLMGWSNLHFNLYDRLPPFRAALQQVKQAHQLPDNEAYLVCYPATEAHFKEGLLRFYTIKYEYETSDIYAVMDTVESDAFLVGSWDAQYETTNPADYMYQYADQCRACIILKRDDKKDDAYDAFIEGYAGNTPVYVCDYSE